MQILNWQGRAVSVNKWLAARAIQQGGKTVATIYKTTVYKNFVKSLADAMISADIKTVPSDAYVDISIFCRMWKMRDSDSSVKPICDAIEDAKIIKNDRQIRDITICRRYHKRDEPDIIRVWIDRISTEKDTVMRDLKIMENRNSRQGVLV